MSKKIVTAVVPVRKGSERVISKNTRPFADTTLLDLKLITLKEVKGIDKIIVNTDCEVSLEIAKKHNVHTHKRLEYFASSQVTNDAHWKHLAEVTETDVLILAQTTSPLIKIESYEKSINYLFEGHDSVNSVSLEKKFLWQNKLPLNYDINLTPKSQDLPNIFSLNFGISIIDRKVMYEKGNVVGNNPKFIELDKAESIDIDDKFDFEFAEYIYMKMRIK